MIGGIILKVLIGVAVGAAAGGATYAVYKILTKDKIKEEVQERISEESSEVLSEAFDIKVKEKIKKGDVINIDDAENWATQDTVVIDVRDKDKNSLISDVVITGDEIGDDVRTGSVITLWD